MSKFSKAFQVVKSGTKEETRFILSGPIIVVSVFPIQDVEGVQHLIMDLKDVILINSGGIRLWLQWMNGIKLLSPNLIITLVHVPKVIIDQINTFRNFIPSPYIVKSLVVPYFCERCNLGQDELLERNVNFSEVAEDFNLKFPEVVCHHCNKPMELDVFPDQYFKFLNSVRDGLAKI